MRVSRVQAEQNRQRVVDVASGLFRAKGFDGVGVAELMQAAGLTHGGFYGSFGSKDELEVEAAQHAFATTGVLLQELIAGSDDPLAAIIGFYLSPAHRDGVAAGCTIAALAQDATRGGPALRATFERGIRDYLALLSASAPEGDYEERQARSMVTLSTLVGALLLARTVTDQGLSNAILQSAAEALLGRPKDLAQRRGSIVPSPLRGG